MSSQEGEREGLTSRRPAARMYVPPAKRNVRDTTLDEQLEDMSLSDDENVSLVLSGLPPERTGRDYRVNALMEMYGCEGNTVSWRSDTEALLKFKKKEDAFQLLNNFRHSCFELSLDKPGYDVERKDEGMRGTSRRSGEGRTAVVAHRMIRHALGREYVRKEKEMIQNAKTDAVVSAVKSERERREREKKADEAWDSLK